MKNNNQYSFENAIKKNHRKELKSFYKELGDRNEEYTDEVSNAGFEDTGDYESHIERNLFIVAIAVVIGMACAIILFFML